MRILILTLALVAAAGVAAAAELPPTPPLPGVNPSVACSGGVGAGIGLEGGEPSVEVSVPTCDVDPGV